MNEIEVPNKEEEAWERLPLPAQKSVRSRPSQLNVPLDTAKALIQAYRASVSFVDAQVGSVMKTLEKTGLAEHTMVIFLSDHGYHLGEHGHWQKQTLFEDATRVPLIVRRGNEHPLEWNSDRPVELVDIYPTVAAWAGIPNDSSLPGSRSLSSQIQARSGVQEHIQFGERGYLFELKTTELPDGDNQGRWDGSLYEHTTDSLELLNVATNKNVGPLFDSLSQMLNHVDSLNRVAPIAAGRVNHSAKPLPRTKPLVKAANTHCP